MNTKELLALGVFGRGSRFGERMAMLLERGREFPARIARGRVAAGGVGRAVSLRDAEHPGNGYSHGAGDSQGVGVDVGQPYQPDYADAFLERLRAEKAFDNLVRAVDGRRMDEAKKTVDTTLRSAARATPGARRTRLRTCRRISRE